MVMLAMPSALKSAASFSYERDDFASYLVVKVEDKNKTINYQADMILNNKIPGILPFDVRRKNNEVYFYYNITSKITLSQFINRIKIKKGQLIDIMLQITRTMLSAMNFLLYNKCFIFQGNYIYVNPASSEIYLVYLPIQVDSDVNKVLRDFIINTVIYSADIAEEDSSNNYIYKILNYVKCETFNVADFNRLLVRLENEDINDVQGEEDQFINAGEKACAMSWKKNYFIYASLAALQLIIALLVLSCSRFLKSLGGDIRTSYIAVGLIVAAVELLAFKNLLRKIKTGSGDNRAESNMDMEASGDASAGRDADKNGIADAARNEEENLVWDVRSEIYHSHNEKKKKCEHANKDRHLVYTGAQERQGEIDILFGENTVLLAVEKNKKPFLRLEGDGFVEEIFISKEDFLIGRLKDQVDYIIKNNAVGKIHAQLISREGKYYVKDLNSKNGTYLNERRIDSNIEYEIEDGDRIRFANSEHIFMLK